ncbi:hypothetical protein AVKW3434_18425 [Acidovorax sp. SUPP3434]|nr:hypothetical protein [Acidovorax sp. SUPP3434]GKT01396.1 hypothetical protein AVKW3434_18425 [Acidovorax sp. SUPP3434]
MLALITPVLAGMGYNAVAVSALVLSARVWLFCHRFMRRGL